MSGWIRDPAEIYRQSFATIRAEADLGRIPPDLADLAVRVVHACGMTDIVADLAWSEGAAEAGRSALASGRPILVDAEMVAHGIIRHRLTAANPVICALGEAGAAEARAAGTTWCCTFYRRRGTRSSRAAKMAGRARGMAGER